jgi:hypothetical protein
MKSIFLAALMAAPIAAASLAAAQAAPAHAVAQVNVTIGPELQAKAKIYGQRELDTLARELKRDVETAVRRHGGATAEGGQLNLVLADATPNHPTFKQLGDTPGLSMQSFGIGGARIEGALVHADGTSEPVRYAWEESDIRQSYGQSTWGDAEWVFQQFADRVAHGEQLAQR